MPLDYFRGDLGERVQIRELRADDEAGLIDALMSLSVETRMARFFHDKHGFSHDELIRLASPSDTGHLKRVAEIVDDDRSTEIVGLARCVRLGATAPIADFGIVVRDGFTRAGIGTRLVLELRAASQATGLTHWRADYFSGNLGVEKLLLSVGREEQREHVGDGIVRVTFRLV